jgi:hypothetical protein
VIKACSEALFNAYGVCINSADPYLPIFKTLKNKDFSINDKIPKLMFTILNGGKSLSSKVRFSKFFIIMDISPSDSIDPIEVFLKL